MKRMCATVYATLAICLLTGGHTLAQGYPPGVNPSNPQDLTNRSNPQSLTLPGASNPQDLVRTPAPPLVVSPGAPRNLQTAIPQSSPSLSHTYTVNPPKKQLHRKPLRRNHGVTGDDNQ